MTQALLLLGTICASLSGIPYVVALLRHQVRPRLVSWLIWTILAIMTTASAALAHEWPSAALSSVTAIMCGSVLLFGWRQATWRISRLDVVCMVGTVCGLVGYFAFGGVAGLVISVAIDGLAFVPTLLHGYSNPDEESMMSFALAAVAGGVILLAAVMDHASFSGVLYPVYGLVFNGAMALIIVSARVGLWTKVSKDAGYDLAE